MLQYVWSSSALVYSSGFFSISQNTRYLLSADLKTATDLAQSKVQGLPARLSLKLLTASNEGFSPTGKLGCLRSMLLCLPLLGASLAHLNCQYWAATITCIAFFMGHNLTRFMLLRVTIPNFQGQKSISKKALCRRLVVLLYTCTSLLWNT